MCALYFQDWFAERVSFSFRPEDRPPKTSRLKPYQPPAVDDDQLEYMCFLLEEAHELQKPVLVTYAGRYSPLQFYGRVKKIQPYEGWFVISNGELKKKIPFGRLMDVDWI
jgi:YolD-like protein